MARALCILAACLTAAAAFAGCVVSGAPFDPIPDAGWKPGYTFGYTVQVQGEGSVRSVIDGEVHEQDITEEMPSGEWPVSSYRVLDATVADGVPIYLALDNHRNLLVFRQADLQPLGATYRYGDGEATVTNLAPTQNSHSWLRFPLERGDTWTGDLQTDPGMMSPITMVTIESTVYGMETVDGPYGPVDAVRIEHDFVFDHDAIESMMRMGAAEEGVEIDLLSFDLSGSRTIHYAPSLHNVVLDESRSSSEFHARFTEDGKEFEVDAEVEFTAIARLAEAILEEQPPTPLDRVDTIRAPRLPAVAPRDGQPGVQLTLSLSETEVNAADSPEVEATVTAVGVSDVVLTLTDSAGQVLDRSRGTSAEWTIDQPGRYVVEASASADGFPLQDSIDLVADYEAVVPAGCGLAAGLLTSCQSVTIPVRPGIQSLTVTAVRDPLTVEEGFGTLYLTGSEVRAEPMQDNEATIHVDQFAPYPYEDWEAWYNPTLGVLEDVEYRIALDYSLPGDLPRAAEADTGRLALRAAAESLAAPWN